MSLANDTVMPVIPAGYGGNTNNDNGWGGDGWWVILLFICLFGWGGFGGWGNNGGGTATQGYDVGADIQRGFDTSGINTKLDAITNGMCQQGYQTQEGFHGVDNAICTLGYQLQDGINDVNTTMLQGFNASNTAVMQGFNASNMAQMQGQNAISSQIAQCCCDTQRSLDGINYNMATQNCATQNVIQNSTRDIIDNQNCNTRQILDYLCQDKISTLQSENQSLRLAASQQAQNSYLVNTLRPAPIPSYPVANPYFVPPAPAPVI